jgi:tetratricopeptide (TPR) repeat protein
MAEEARMNEKTILTAILALALPALAPAQGPDRSSPAASAQIFAELGGTHRRITTRVPLAQRYFDQGLNLAYGFNHDEAVRSFAAAARKDPSCAICYWGIAYASGPHINNATVDADHAKAALDALAKARAVAPKASPVERDLIAAQAARYSADLAADRAPLDQAYADAMRGVWARHPKDADVGMLFAEASMNVHPWDLWTPDGKAQPWTEEILSTLEAVLKLDPNHPGANHLYIHSVEGSPHPERALASADRLAGGLVPGAGHLVHMPGHIYQRVGRYDDAAEANRKAIAVDDKYVGRVPQQGFYLMYKAHNHQFLAFSAMSAGRAAEAVTASNAMLAQFPPEMVHEMVHEMAAAMDGVVSLPEIVLVRFGRWDEILARPGPDPVLKASTGIWHWSRGMALAARGKLPEADAELAALAKSAAGIEEGALVGFNPAKAILGIASDMLAAELAAKRGATEVAIRRLQAAAAAEDGLRYNEPSDWPLPVRHYLGAALLAAGQPDAAEAVYREDLRRNPENGWALQGLAAALRARGQAAEADAVAARAQKAWAHGDVRVTGSRF